MIYIKNNTKTQRVYLPKEDGIIRHSGGGGGEDCDYCYNVGYEDGLADGEDKQKKRLGHLDVTENGNYNNANSGWSSVTVTVPQTGHTQQEIDDAYQSGITYQKSLLGSTAITTNTTVMNGNGWSAVTVNVPDRYSEGYSDGEEHQKSLLSSTAITQNGDYTSENGFDEVSVNVPSRWQEGYDQGYGDGVNHQKSLLTTTAITQNGTYTSENGFEEVSVNVPQNNPAIEQNKGFTATTNGTSSITPSPIWEILFTSKESIYDNYYHFTIDGTISSGYYGQAAYRLDYHNVEDYGYVLIKIDSNGGLELDTSNYDQETEPVWLRFDQSKGRYDFGGNRISASNFTVHPLSNVEYYYAMSGVDLTVNVDMTEAYNSGKTDGYNSGYTAGQDSITSTFTSLTVNQNGNYGSSAHPITALTVQVTESYGELYCLYCENAVFHINSGNGITDSVTLYSATADFYGDFAGRFYRGDSDIMAIWSATQNTSGGTDYLRCSVTWGNLVDVDRATITANTPNIQMSFVDMNTLLVRRVQKLGLYKDGWQMGELVTAPVVSGNNFTFNMYGYLKSININYNYCGLLPFVDSDGNAGLVWNSTRIYPTSGNCYPVYKKTVGGVDKYIVVGNLTV